MVVMDPQNLSAAKHDGRALSEWGRSDWLRREVIHTGPGKVHFDTRFVRFVPDGSLIQAFDSIYIVTLQDNHWGRPGAIQIRSLTDAGP